MSREDDAEAKLDKDWGDVWDDLPDAPPLVPAHLHAQCRATIARLEHEKDVLLKLNESSAAGWRSANARVAQLLLEKRPPFATGADALTLKHTGDA